MGLDFVVRFISRLPESCPSFAQWVTCRWKLFSKFSQGLCISVVLLTYYMHALIECAYVILQMEMRIHIIILSESYGNISCACEVCYSELKQGNAQRNRTPYLPLMLIHNIYNISISYYIQYKLQYTS